MVGMAVRGCVSLICNTHSFNALSPNLTTESARTITKMPAFSSAATYFLIFNRGFCSDSKASDSGDIKLGRKDQSRNELTAFLKSYDFSQAEIDSIVQRFPRILCYRVSTNLKPKLDYFVECGVSRSALRIVFVSNPGIFRMSLDSSLKPRYQFLQTYLKDNGHAVLKCYSHLLCSHNVKTNIEYLKKQGVPDSSIAKLLTLDPRALWHSMNRLVKLVEATKELGIKPGAAMFVRYIWVFGSMSETSWKKKVEVFKSLGWSDKDVRFTLLSYPACFRVSEEKLRKNMDFYINNVKMEAEDIIRLPMLLMFSLNGRIAPRCEVMKLLKEYDLLKSSKVSSIFMEPEKQFISKYIEKNVEKIPHLLQVYCDSKKAKAEAA